MHNCKQSGCHHPDNVSQSNCTGCIEPKGKIEQLEWDSDMVTKDALYALREKVREIIDHLNSKQDKEDPPKPTASRLTQSQKDSLLERLPKGKEVITPGFKGNIWSGAEEMVRYTNARGFNQCLEEVKKIIEEL